MWPYSDMFVPVMVASVSSTKGHPYLVFIGFVGEDAQQAKKNVSYVLL